LAADAAADSGTVLVATGGGLDPAAPHEHLWVVIDGHRYPVSGVAGPDAQDRIELTFPSGTRHPAWSTGLAVQRVRRAKPDGSHATLRVGGASRLYQDAVVQLDDGSRMTVHRVTGIAADVVTLAPEVDRAVFENDRLYLVEAEVSARFASAAGDTAQETI